MKDRILDQKSENLNELRATILYMSRCIIDAQDLLDLNDPEGAKLTLSKAVGNPKYTYF